MTNNWTNTNQLSELKELYSDTFTMKTTADFKLVYRKEASKLEKIVYGLEKSDKQSIGLFLMYAQNPLLR